MEFSAVEWRPAAAGPDSGVEREADQSLVEMESLQKDITERQNVFVDRSVDLRRLERQERRLRLQNDTLLSRILQLDSSRAYDAWSSDDLSGASSGEDDDAGEVFVEPTPQKDFRGHSFPIHVENSGSAQLKVYSLGRVVHDRDAFHTPKHIWPVSYVCTRRYVSMKNPKRTTTYKCEIYDGGDAPMFRITPADDVEHPVEAQSSSAAWKAVLVEVNKKKFGIESRSNPPGPDVFGLNDPIVRALILKLPDADKCRKYGKPPTKKRAAGKDEPGKDDVDV